MCGIALVVHGTGSSFPASTLLAPGRVLASNKCKAADFHELVLGLTARGPDHVGTEQVLSLDGACILSFAASLLQLRGAQPGSSPCLGSGGHVLCFNGEVFGGLDIRPRQNDSECLFAALVQARGAVPDVLGKLRGPWALLFWDPRHQRLWFGRDALGRRSLLIHCPDAADPRLLFTSVTELPSASAPQPGTAAAERTPGATAPAPGVDGAAKGPAGLGAPSGGGGEAEDPEPSGSDGYWTELPPGLYSMRFAPPDLTAAALRASSGQAGIRAGEESRVAAAAVPSATGANGTHHPSVVPADAPHSCGADACESGTVAPPDSFRLPSLGAEGAEADPRVVWQFPLGGVERQVVRHAWRDSVLLDLEAYRRPETVGAGSCGGIAEVDAEGSGASRAGHVGLGQCCGDGVGEETREGALLPGDSSLLAGPVTGAEAAAHALLRVLLAAVRVRCACVETRSPHPAAAYAATAQARAAAAAATDGRRSPAQPSWRRDNPQDFSTCQTPVDLPTSKSDPRVTSDGARSNGDGDGCAPGARPQPAAGGLTADDAPVMILFSGGVDSVLLAALAHQVLPPAVPIDLSNVCFAGGTSPDREAARAALEELAAACPGRRWRLVEVDATLEDVDRHRSRLLALLRPAGTVMDLNIGAALWLAVSGQGKLRLPRTQARSADAADVGANIGACNGRGTVSSHHASGQPAQSNRSTCEGSGGSGGSDNGTGGGSGDGDSDGGAGGGLADGQFYASAARVVLLGHGADEQCGGYGRHRTRFRSGGWAGLSGELEVDVRRLWLRNLGRDDRLVADWGREARHPFLDEGVTELLLRTPLDCILDLRLPAGQGDKRVLRRCLQLLGLPDSAARVKRAIQFGSRIGKMSNRRDFGSNRAANKKNAGSVALQDVQRTAAEAAAGAWTKEPKARGH